MENLDSYRLGLTPIYPLPLYAARAKMAIAKEWLEKNPSAEAQRGYENAVKRLQEIEVDLLPYGSHLLPNEYRWFLLNWNANMEHACGGWTGKERMLYKATHPVEWKYYMKTSKELSAKFAQEVLAVKQYQVDNHEDVVAQVARERREMREAREVEAVTYGCCGSKEVR